MLGLKCGALVAQPSQCRVRLRAAWDYSSIKVYCNDQLRVQHSFSFGVPNTLQLQKTLKL